MPDRTAGRRVLIVEDQKRLRAILQDVITDLGFQVSTAGSAEEAIALQRARPQEILLVDLQLPGMSGLELLSHARAHWPDMQAIILTAFGDLDAARQAIHLQVVEFLCKPIHLRDIELALDQAVRRLEQQAPQAAQSMLLDSEPAITLAQSEHRQILAALQRHGGNRTAAAEELGISRRTLHYRLAEYRRRGWPTGEPTASAAIAPSECKRRD